MDPTRSERDELWDAFQQGLTRGLLSHVVEVV